MDSLRTSLQTAWDSIEPEMLRASSENAKRIFEAVGRQEAVITTDRVALMKEIADTAGASGKKTQGTRAKVGGAEG